MTSPHVETPSSYFLSQVNAFFPSNTHPRNACTYPHFCSDRFRGHSRLFFVTRVKTGRGLLLCWPFAVPMGCANGAMSETALVCL